MSVTVKVNGTDNTLVHKGSTGIARNTAPDVCKTPSPGGPVPVPYPVIISMSSDLADGTTTVEADGGNMCAIKGSNFSRCSGDEAGTAGGVKSSTNMKEATWISYSFDVKLDGKNACRKTDKMMMNHENTICMAGEDQMAKIVKSLEEMACDCAKKHTYKEIYDEDSEDGWLNCVILGSRRHKCVSDKLNPPNGDPSKSGVHAGGGANYDSNKLPEGQAYCRPDVVVTAPGVSPPIDASQMKAIFDLKFPCNKPGEGFGSDDPSKMLGKAQRECYEKIKLPGKKAKPGGVPVKAIGPTDENCP
jgi:hypothetical protein